MMELLNVDDNLTIASHLTVCEGTYDRLKGLLGVRHLDDHQALWIRRCNAIHTFFMLLTIDAAFLDDDMRVVRLIADMKPWRVCLPARRATSVIEGPAGMIRRGNLREGSRLGVTTGHDHSFERVKS